MMKITQKCSVMMLLYLTKILGDQTVCNFVTISSAMLKLLQDTHQVLQYHLYEGNFLKLFGDEVMIPYQNKR